MGIQFYQKVCEKGANFRINAIKTNNSDEQLEVQDGRVSQTQKPLLKKTLNFVEHYHTHGGGIKITKSA